MIGGLLTLLGNLILIVVIGVALISAAFIFFVHRAMRRGMGQNAPSRYGSPRPGVRIVDSTVVDEPSTSASGKTTPRAADIPDSAEVQIIEVTTRED